MFVIAMVVVGLAFFSVVEVTNALSVTDREKLIKLDHQSIDGEKIVTSMNNVNIGLDKLKEASEVNETSTAKRNADAFIDSFQDLIPKDSSFNQTILIDLKESYFQLSQTMADINLKDDSLRTIVKALSTKTESYNDIYKLYYGFCEAAGIKPKEKE
ncbi:MAG: hypothetical protein SH856_02215 [Flavobacteriales bacterium]|nr:hypothetical protein [Flavobacteriales bacterium]